MLTLLDLTNIQVLLSGRLVKELGATALFRIRGFGDAARDPTEFTVAPADAIPKVSNGFISF